MNEDKIIAALEKAIERQTTILIADRIFGELLKGGFVDPMNQKYMVKKAFEGAEAFIENCFEPDEEPQQRKTITSAIGNQLI